jgi:penicillin amidase
MISILLKLGVAKDCRQLHEALRLWTNPVQNVVYADVQGNIGYTLAGKIPIRSKGRGRLPVPGWTSEFEWKSYIPFEAIPHLENPPQGFIVTANNRVVGEDYPFRLDLEPISGDRAQRITEMILDTSTRNGMEKIDIPFIKKMQFDQVSPSGRFFAIQLAQIQEINSAHSPESDLHAVQQLFREWDGMLSPTNPAVAIYEVFIRKFGYLVLSKKIEAIIRQRSLEEGKAKDPSFANSQFIDDTVRWIMGKGITPVLAEASLFGEHWLPWLMDKINVPNSHWFDLGQGESKDDVMRMALELAITELKGMFGEDMSKWNWGKLHQLTFVHTLSSKAILKPLFDIGPYPVGGDHTTIWATGTNYHDLAHPGMVGPPFRMIVDLGQLENSIAILAPGQSGNPASLHYRDQVSSWFDGNYHPMMFKRHDIEQQSKYRLKLIPG